MPESRLSGALMSPKVNLMVDMGNPFLNHTLDGFLKIGGVAAAKAAAEETYKMGKRGSVSGQSLEQSVRKMCKEGAYWGTVAGVYVGMEFGVEKVRGTRDWKNSLIGGALTGAIVSTASGHDKDKIVFNTIAAAAIATAKDFLAYLT
ncbi:hypothetical protein M569_07245 [Genlisea aurea]|uniref:Uncharacterized protein n=1 Tax=Genlisea aurea TaxID=192259 RepID=S8CRN9_9LAMI|nr:hypothetical protein M569_07245 [Genlisea aurea]